MSINHKRRLMLIGTATAGLSAFATIVVAQPQERIVKVVARKFNFTPDKIPLKKNVPVVFELTTLDVIMGFNLPDFGLRADIMPGTVSRVRFTPDRTGEFPFHCDIFCGSGHEDMTGVITVT